MTDHDKNIRTLVLCFVLAVMALIPLRIVEFSQNVEEISSVQVLGETVEQENEEVILPNGELSADQINYGDEITEKDLLY
jgi:hypothetical protein